MESDSLETRIRIIPQLKADSKEQLFHALIEQTAITEVQPEILVEKVMAREAQDSTALGEGNMFPHTRIPNLNNLYVTIATLAQPLDIPTPDNCPVQVACLLLIPEEHPMLGLKYMASLAACLRNERLHNMLIFAKTPAEANDFIHALRGEEKTTLKAKDVMIKCEHFTTKEVPLKIATQNMMKWDAEVLPVLDGEKIVGEISCDELFKLGIPDFFTQLKSVSFIRHYDPFENYFKMEAQSNVGDVMNTDFPTYSPETTLIEIVFEISVRKHKVLFIADEDKKLLGIINQAVLLERIINL